MKLLGQMLLVCLILGAIQAVIVVIAIAFMLLLVWGLLFRTKETAGLIALCLLIEGFQVHPLVTTCVIALLVGLLLIPGRKEPPPGGAPTQTVLLPPQSGTDECSGSGSS